MSYVSLAAVVIGALAAATGAFAGWIGLSILRFRSYYRHKGEVPPPMPPWALARYAVGELLALATLGWWQLRAGRRNGLLRPLGEVTGPPVVCVHGITQDGSNLWGIRRALARRGRPSRAVSLGRYGRSLEAHVPPFVAALRELARLDPAGQVDVVAHSMGGVIVRMALTTHPELAASVRRVVTLGSPHSGTAAGRGLPLAGAARFLGRRSEVLRRLPGFPATAALTTIAARHDLVVYPQTTCHLDGARALDLPDVGHAGLLTRPAVQALVVEALCAEDAELPPDSPLRG